MSNFTPAATSEAESAEPRRRSEGWFEKYLVGTGLDVGCGPSAVSPNARAWDICYGDSDATHLSGLADNTFNFVHASHILEHLAHPRLALANWWRVLRPGGHLLLSVPEEDSYEKGLWPSIQNTDHRSTWCAWTSHTWSPVGYSMLEVLRVLDRAKLLSLCLTEDNGEWASVEAVVQKHTTTPVLTDPVAGKIYCMCGCADVLFRGTTVVGQMRFECLECGQLAHHGLLEHAETVERNTQLLQRHNQ